MQSRSIGFVVLAATLAGACANSAKTGDPAMHPADHTDAMHAQGHGADTVFAALQDRGKVAMGVDQYTSTHKFDDLPDGGRIELQRDVDDPSGIGTIREHLRSIANAFSHGEFSTPAFVHMQNVPGTKVMAERRAMIAYTFSELPRGGELRMTTTDPAALRAIHEFLAFQRKDHRAQGISH